MEIIFSFDDNEKLNMCVADLFDEFGFKATFFINPIPRPQNTPMGRDDIIDLDLRGFEIGAHTMTHQRLTLLSPEKTAWELYTAKEHLEEMLKSDIKGFCYPKGVFDNYIKSKVEFCGYRYARTVGEGNTIVDDKYAIKPTIQIYNSSRRRYIRLKRCLFHNENFSVTGSWNSSAKSFIKTTNGDVRIWGHAEEINRQKQWSELDDLLEWIKNNGYKVITEGQKWS